MFEVKLTIGLNAETISLFSSLLGTPKPQAFAPVADIPSVTNGKARKIDTVAEKQQPESETKQEITGGIATQILTLEAVRAAVQAKAQSGKRDEVKALVKSFGAENVASLDKEKYLEFMTKLESI